MGGITKRTRGAAVRRRDGSAGFAAVDALVALTLLSTTLVLALQAASTVQKTSAAALEGRRAKALLDYLMVSDRPAAGHWSGVSGDLRWNLAIRPQTTPETVCRRSALARSEKSNRRYEVSTLEPCPREEAT
jgi:hypothetical protein